jgi:hypothetical protein
MGTIRKTGAAVALCASLAFLLTLGASRASADTITYNITSPNSDLSGFTGPYATVKVDLTSSTTATITFTSDTNGGYIYLMGATRAVDLNVNGPFTLGTVTETNSIGGFKPTFDTYGSGNVDGMGNFNLILINKDGFKDSATTISFTLTLTSGTWSSAADVLTPNAGGFVAAIHGFACSEAGSGCSTTGTGAIATGYAGDGPGTPTPEPASLVLFGTGLLVLGTKLRRRPKA